MARAPWIASRVAPRPRSRGGAAARAAWLVLLLAAGALAGCMAPASGGFPSDPANPRVLLSTSMGNLTLELFPAQAPVTVARFLAHVEERFYDGLIFHRVIQGFVVQGGGHWPNGTLRVSPFEHVPLEVHPALTHRDGCVGMARGADPDSATSQFYLCDGPQHRLDDAVRQQERGERGYAVFGRIEHGLEVARAMAEQPTDSLDRPLANLVLHEARRVGSTDRVG